MFEDEARFGRISDPRRCWAPPGVRPEVSTQFIREYEYAFAAVSPQDGLLDTLVLPTVNTEAMGIFLAEVSQRHAAEFIVMVLDGAGWHRAKRLPVPANIRLISLPPWSPPVEPGRACLGRSAREVVCQPGVCQSQCCGRTTHHRFEDLGSGLATGGFLNWFRLDQNYSPECALVSAAVWRIHARSGTAWRYKESTC
jgi:DDE superfamily endonuclease